jgi:hypothetical protein
MPENYQKVARSKYFGKKVYGVRYVLKDKIKLIPGVCVGAYYTVGRIVNTHYIVKTDRGKTLSFCFVMTPEQILERNLARCFYYGREIEVED